MCKWKKKVGLRWPMSLTDGNDTYTVFFCVSPLLSFILYEMMSKTKNLRVASFRCDAIHFNGIHWYHLCLGRENFICLYSNVKAIYIQKYQSRFYRIHSHFNWLNRHLRWIWNIEFDKFTARDFTRMHTQFGAVWFAYNVHWRLLRSKILISSKVFVENDEK